MRCGFSGKPVGGGGGMAGEKGGGIWWGRERWEREGRRGRGWGRERGVFLQKGSVDLEALER